MVLSLYFCETSFSRTPFDFPLGFIWVANLSCPTEYQMYLDYVSDKIIYEYISPPPIYHAITLVSFFVLQMQGISLFYITPRAFILVFFCCCCFWAFFLQVLDGYLNLTLPDELYCHYLKKAFPDYSYFLIACFYSHQEHSITLFHFLHSGTWPI